MPVETAMRTALYLRVSTEHQKPDLQADGMRRYAAHANLDIVAQYLDVAFSGRKEGRPQLQALMRAARHHEFDCVLVWKFDRFARSVTHLLRALEEFEHLGIRFISVQDQIDTQSPMGRTMFTIIGAMAELESSLISERVKAGMAAARARGKPLGRPATPTRFVERGRRVSQLNRPEYSADSRSSKRASEPVGGGRNCEAGQSMTASGTAMAGFYTYPDHTPSCVITWNSS